MWRGGLRWVLIRFRKGSMLAEGSWSLDLIQQNHPSRWHAYVCCIHL